MVKISKCALIALMHKKWTLRVELTKKTSHCKSRDFLRKRRLKMAIFPVVLAANLLDHRYGGGNLSPLEAGEAMHYSAQASYFAAFRGIRDTKIEKSHGIQDKISL